MSTFKRLLASVAFIAAMQAAVDSQAALLAVVNGDFESLSPIPGGFPQAAGWDGANTARLTPHAGFTPTAGAAPASLGDGFAFTQNTTGPAEQTLSDTYEADKTYTLTSFASYGASDNPDIIYSLGYDGGLGFVELGTATNDYDGDSTWRQMPGVTTTVPAGDGAVGQSIIIRIQSSQLQGVWFDSVSVEEIPEPAAAALALTVSLIFAGYRGRK